MSDGQGETVYEQVYGERSLDFTEGPGMAYQAFGGANWQTADGWGYRPINRPAIVHRLRRRAIELQADANALAAFGMGRGQYPEWSEELASLARRMGVWAETIETEDAVQAAERGE